MKLPDFTLHEPLNDLRRTMGAPLGEYISGIPTTTLTMIELEQLMDGGIEVEMDSVTVLPDGTLAYKDSRVLLYIRDVHVHGNRKDRAVLPRYHVYHCSTLREMREKKRWERYVIATRSDGFFSINRIAGNNNIESEMCRLAICQNCLNGLSFEEFSYSSMAKDARTRIVREFTIERFYAVYAKSFFVEIPNHTADTASLNAYPAGFPLLALEVKERAGWRCSKCALTLEGADRRFLHVHHKNGQKQDSGLSNLDVLCLGCHAAEPLHAHMRTHQDYQLFEKRYGRRAGR